MAVRSAGGRPPGNECGVKTEVERQQKKRRGWGRWSKGGREGLKREEGDGWIARWMAYRGGIG